MATKTIKVIIDEKEVEATIRRIKKKEFKAVAVTIATKVDELAKLFDEKDVISKLPNLLETNIDFICNDIIQPFVSLNPEEIDEMDVVDILHIGKELLNFNGISEEKLISFLNLNKDIGGKTSEVMNFQGVEVPLQNQLMRSF